MALNSTLKPIAETIANDLREGRATRTTLGSPTVAFGWIGDGPVTIASFVTTMTADTLSFPITRVTPSATTPATVVAAGVAKPVAVDVATSTTTLVKHAGQASVQLEQMLSGDGLLAAVSSVLYAGCLLSFEASAIAVLDAAAGGSVTSATEWSSAIAAAQGQVLAAGGKPGLIVVSAADYAALIADIAGSAGFAADPSSAIGSFLGALLHVSPKAAAGKAWVLDPQSVAAIEHRDSPVLISDPYSGSATNVVRLVADLLATVEVLNPKHVIEITAPAGATTAAVAARKK